MPDLKFHAEFLNTYLEMVEDTESPRLYHVWGAMSALAMAMGRRCWLPFGPGNTYPNQFVLFVGNPGTRKSTAAKIAQRLVRSATGVRFAPRDTAGQRQGLIAAMSNSGPDKEFLGAVELTARDNSISALTLSDIAESTNDPEDETAQFIAQADKHHIAVISTEFSGFIGQNNLSMLDFLASMWDGDDYDYRTKTGESVLKNPLVNILGCTTPTQIANSMPAAAGGQGFLSRLILVYGRRKYKSIARPPTPPVELVDRVKEHLNHVYYEFNGAFDETPEGRAYSESLYNTPLEITDPRFGYYNERRYDHLIKLAMCLAAARRDRVICKEDYEQAHRILRATERGMPDALGEFGMSPLASLKQAVLEFMRTHHALALDDLRGYFHRDSRAIEFKEVISDLVKMNQINLAQNTSGQLIVSARVQKKDTEDVMLKLLSE